MINGWYGYFCVLYLVEFCYLIEKEMVFEGVVFGFVWLILINNWIVVGNWLIGVYLVWFMFGRVMFR